MEQKLRGAYGLGLDGPWSDARRLLPLALVEWPRWAVVSREGAHANVTTLVAPTFATLHPPSGGTIHIDGVSRRIVVTASPARGAFELIHPTLAHAASIVSWWSGRESFHGGGVVVGLGTWGVLAPRGGGKSSTLAQFAAAGLPILADDLLVLDNGSALVGPRALDLRADAAAHFGRGESMGVLGLRERWRVELGPCPAVSPLRGWLVLEWGETLESRRLGGAELLRVLGSHRAVNLPPANPAALIELSTLPAWSIQRPRDMRMLPRVLELVLALTA
jgi:hypothetical protein